MRSKVPEVNVRANDNQTFYLFLVFGELIGNIDRYERERSSYKLWKKRFNCAVYFRVFQKIYSRLVQDDERNRFRMRGAIEDISPRVLLMSSNFVQTVHHNVQNFASFQGH